MNRFLPCAALALLPTLAWAQPAPVPTAWVHPQSGDDSMGMVNDLDEPFQTLNAAIAAVDAAGGGRVIGLPGLYSDDPVRGNNESFPIRMREQVDVVGVGAKECVIRNTETNSSPEHLFWPDMPNDGTNLYPVNVGVLFSREVHDDRQTTLEGFTLQGGDVQVYAYGEHGQRGRVSNCVFDMRVDDDHPGPSFGMLITSVWNFSGAPSERDYPELDYAVLNNTFIQGAEAEGGIQGATASSVALCNVNDPASWAGDDVNDDDTTLRGISDLNVQNNLIRSYPGYPRTAMLGIDDGDASVAVGTRTGPSNAFDPDLVGDDNGFFYSRIGAGMGQDDPAAAVELDSRPVPLTTFDPPFVGESVSPMPLGTHPWVRDWRLMPGSALEDAGSAPVQQGNLIVLEAASGSRHIEGGTLPAFDWDGEGQGNPRIEGDFPDIGFDEVGSLIITGSYGNDSKSHHTPFHASIEPGNDATQRFYLMREQAVATLYVTRSAWTDDGWVASPGSHFGVPVAGLGINYLIPSMVISQGLGISVQVNWVHIDGTPYTYHVVTGFNPPEIVPEHMNSQLLMQTVGGLSLSNLQFEIY